MKKLKTPDQARAWFDQHGMSVAEWARTHGFGDSLVREILAGRKKCKRGMSHNIAILLGMKDGVLSTTGRKRGGAA